MPSLQKLRLAHSSAPVGPRTAPRLERLGLAQPLAQPSASVGQRAALRWELLRWVPDLMDGAKHALPQLLQSSIWHPGLQQGYVCARHWRSRLWNLPMLRLPRAPHHQLGRGATVLVGQTLG